MGTPSPPTVTTTTSETMVTSTPAKENQEAPPLDCSLPSVTMTPSIEAILQQIEDVSREMDAQSESSKTETEQQEQNLEGLPVFENRYPDIQDALRVRVTLVLSFRQASTRSKRIHDNGPVERHHHVYDGYKFNHECLNTPGWKRHIENWAAAKIIMHYPCPILKKNNIWYKATARKIGYTPKGATSHLTAEPVEDISRHCPAPMWSPDGQEIVYTYHVSFELSLTKPQADDQTTNATNAVEKVKQKVVRKEKETQTETETTDFTAFDKHCLTTLQTLSNDPDSLTTFQTVSQLLRKVKVVQEKRLSIAGVTTSATGETSRAHKTSHKRNSQSPEARLPKKNEKKSLQDRLGPPSKDLRRTIETKRSDQRSRTNKTTEEKHQKQSRKSDNHRRSRPRMSPYPETYA